MNTLTLHNITMTLGLVVSAFALSATDKTHTKNTALDAANNVSSYISCLAQQSVTLVSAHRGGPKPGFPENALETLQEAVKYGPMLLEVDVRETADGELVLLHDTTLDRTTTGKGKLSEHTLADLKALRLIDNEGKVTPFAVPTLREVLLWADDRAIVQVDVKRGVSYQKVAQLIAELDAVDSTLIIAYRLQDAVTASGVNSNFSFSYSINTNEDLIALKNAGISPLQIVAWTGVVEEGDKPIWDVLETRGIPFATGAFWHLEEKIIETGNTAPYNSLAESGVDVVGSDHYWLAFDTLAEQQDIAGAIASCYGS